jgi:hypothetical protein
MRFGVQVQRFNEGLKSLKAERGTLNLEPLGFKVQHK